MSDLFSRPIDLDSVDLDRYCERVAYTGPRVPSLATLQELHWLHPAAIPFETLDVRLGLGIELDAERVDAKLIGARRGGYCFEHNTLFLRVLRCLGFEAEPLIARSLWGRPPDELHPRTHMAIRVRVNDVEWLADVGFGASMLTAPLRLDVQEPQQTRHEAARLAPIGEELRLERFIAGAWAPVGDLLLARQEPADIAAANWLICNHPASPFRHRLVVSRTRDEQRHVLVDARLTIRHAGGHAEHRVLDADGIEDSFGEHFGLPVQDSWRPLFEELASRENH